MRGWVGAAALLLGACYAPIDAPFSLPPCDDDVACCQSPMHWVWIAEGAQGLSAHAYSGADQLPFTVEPDTRLTLLVYGFNAQELQLVSLDRAVSPGICLYDPSEPTRRSPGCTPDLTVPGDGSGRPLPPAIAQYRWTPQVGGGGSWTALDSLPEELAPLRVLPVNDEDCAKGTLTATVGCIEPSGCDAIGAICRQRKCGTGVMIPVPPKPAPPDEPRLNDPICAPRWLSAEVQPGAGGPRVCTPPPALTADSRACLFGYDEQGACAPGAVCSRCTAIDVWPDTLPAAGRLVFVGPLAQAGGQGTQAQPKPLAEALLDAAPDTVIVLAIGVYPGLVLPDDAHLYGVSPSFSRLGPVLAQGTGVRLERLQVPSLRLAPGAALELRDVEAAVDREVEVRDRAELRAERAVLGWLSVGAQGVAQLAQVELRSSTTAALVDGGRLSIAGMGSRGTLAVRGGGRALLSGAVLPGLVEVEGQGSALEIAGSALTPGTGIGLHLHDGATATVSASWLAPGGEALVVSQGTLHLYDSWLELDRARKGVSVLDGALLHAERSAVHGGTRALYAEQAKLSLQQVALLGQGASGDGSLALRAGGVLEGAELVFVGGSSTAIANSGFGPASTLEDARFLGPSAGAAVLLDEGAAIDLRRVGVNRYVQGLRATLRSRLGLEHVRLVGEDRGPGVQLTAGATSTMQTVELEAGGLSIRGAGSDVSAAGLTVFAVTGGAGIDVDGGHLSADGVSLRGLYEGVSVRGGGSVELSGLSLEADTAGGAPPVRLVDPGSRLELHHAVLSFLGQGPSLVELGGEGCVGQGPTLIAERLGLVGRQATTRGLMARCGTFQATHAELAGFVEAAVRVVGSPQLIMSDAWVHDNKAGIFISAGSMPTLTLTGVTFEPQASGIVRE